MRANGRRGQLLRCTAEGYAGLAARPPLGREVRVRVGCDRQSRDQEYSARGSPSELLRDYNYCW
jgi:hypothetical protein